MATSPAARYCAIRISSAIPIRTTSYGARRRATISQRGITQACSSSSSHSPSPSSPPAKISRRTMSAAVASTTTTTTTPTSTLTSTNPEVTLPAPLELSSLQATWRYHDTKPSSPSSLTQTYIFPDFSAAWGFMSAVAVRCDTVNHHPEWSNVYNRVFMRWTTHHKSLGVRRKDRVMATACDELAARFGGRGKKGDEVDGDGDGEGLDGMLAAVKQSAGEECCTPSSRGQPACGADAKAGQKEELEKMEREEGGKGSLAGVGGQPS